jgi:hypothetical protein
MVIMTSNISGINIRINKAFKLRLNRSFVAIVSFIFLLWSIRSFLLICFTPSEVFNIPLRSITDIVAATISVVISFRIKEDSHTNSTSKKANVNKFYIYGSLFLLIVLAFGGVILWSQIQSAMDKHYYENHKIEFKVVEHDEIQKSKVYSSVTRIQSALETLRNRHQIFASGAPLKELHLYANHDSFIKQTGSTSDTAALFYPQTTGIYMPADIYLTQPETILHEVMHSFIYEISGKSNEEIPLWFHDGYAQYSSMNWLDLTDKRVRIKFSLWEEKPKDLQVSAFLLYRSQYPSDFKLKELFYKSSFAFVDYLESRTNSNLFTQTLFDISRGKSFSIVINEKVGNNLDSLYYTWVNQITGLE